MITIDTEIGKKIDIKLKEILELLNKKSENECVLADIKISQNSEIESCCALETTYNISFKTVLISKE